MDKSLILAEAGCNFNGKLSIAKKMADEAKKCGVDVVKYQTFWNLGCLKNYEMPKKDWIDLKGYCDKIGIEFMSTPHWGSPIGKFYKEEDYDVIDFVDNLVKRHKVASPYLTNQKYIRYISSLHKPLIISTGSIIHEDGMATIEEIERCLYWIEDCDITLLHCVSKYPAKEYNWKRIEELKRFGFPVGVSDHTKSLDGKPYPVIEKHFELNDNCIDANVSLNPKQFKEYVKSIKEY